MMPASQLSSDDLRNVGQALVMHNSLNILPAIKLILGWDIFFRSASPEFSGGMTCVLQTKLSTEGRWSQLVKDSSIQLEDLPGFSGEKNVTEHQQLY